MSHTVETKALWSLLHRSREERNKQAAYCANRAITCAVRGLTRDASAWEALANFELANPEPEPASVAVSGSQESAGEAVAQ